jgi:hypothetical protein
MLLEIWFRVRTTGGRAFWLLIMLAGSASRVALAATQPSLLDDMNGPRPAMRLADAEASVRMLAQAIDARAGQYGSPAETVSLAVPAGALAPLAYQIPPAPVIQELRFAVQARCNRPGMQLAVRVVLPRDRDARTDLPRQLLVRSIRPPVDVGWQRLELSDLPTLVEQHVRVARAKYGGAVDSRGAYVSAVALLPPGGRGETQIVVDEIAVYGVLRAADPHAARIAAEPIASATGYGAAASGPATTPFPASEMPPRPRTPRCIEWRGEPFGFLRQLGFHGAWLAKYPTARQLSEARLAGLFLVCPPPADGFPDASPADALQPILAWDLGEAVVAEDLAAAQRAKSQIRRADPASVRPALLRSRLSPREASRIADAFVAGRPVADSSLTTQDYAAFMQFQHRLATPGAPQWVELDADASSRTTAQLGGSGAIAAPSLDRLAQSIDASLAARPCGYLFRSNHDLTGRDLASRRRALALTLVNRRLDFLEPWLAACKGAGGATTTRGEPAFVFTTERSHLAVGVCRDQRTATSEGESPDSLVLPGAPETLKAFLVTSTGLVETPARRVTGGLQIELGVQGDWMALISDDEAALSQVKQFLGRRAAQHAHERIELCVLERLQAVESMARLPQTLLEDAGAKRLLTIVDDQLAAVSAASQARDLPTAAGRVEAADQALGALRRSLCRTLSLSYAGSCLSSMDDWNVIAAAAQAADVAAASTVPLLQVDGGDFEATETLLSGGWEAIENAGPGVAARVALSDQQPAEGTRCLELSATSTSAASDVAANSPAWITSPPLSVPAGCLIEIRGVVRLLEAPQNTIDPFVVFDSLGGEEQSVRFQPSSQWQAFRLLRAAPKGGECRVTFALGGCGRAQVDAVAYRLIPYGQALETARRAVRVK